MLIVILLNLRLKYLVEIMYKRGYYCTLFHKLCSLY